MNKERSEVLSDGVFAIANTPLVLTIAQPTNLGHRLPAPATRSRDASPACTRIETGLPQPEPSLLED